MNTPPNPQQPPSFWTRIGSAINPLPILKDAVAAVPEMKYALAVLGVAAALAIGLGWFTNLGVAAFGVPVVIALMVLLLLFAVAANERPYLKWSAIVLVNSVVVLGVVTMALFLSWVFFNWPSPVGRLLNPPPKMPLDQIRATGSLDDGGNLIVHLSDIPQAPIVLKATLVDSKTGATLQGPADLNVSVRTKDFVVRAEEVPNLKDANLQCHLELQLNGVQVSNASKPVAVTPRHQ